MVFFVTRIRSWALLTWRAVADLVRGRCIAHICCIFLMSKYTGKLDMGLWTTSVLAKKNAAAGWRLPIKIRVWTQTFVQSCNCSAEFFLQVPKLCTDLDPTLLYIWILRIYGKLTGKVKILALGVCFPQTCSSVGRIFAASRSHLHYYQQIISTNMNSMKSLVNWTPLRIRVRSRNTQPHLNHQTK